MESWSTRIKDILIICSEKKLLIKVWKSKENSLQVRNIGGLRNHCEAIQARYQIGQIEQVNQIEVAC